MRKRKGERVVSNGEGHASIIAGRVSHWAWIKGGTYLKKKKKKKKKKTTNGRQVIRQDLRSKADGRQGVKREKEQGVVIQKARG